MAAITSYATLKTAIQNWMDRDDLSGNVDEFIDLVESDIAEQLRAINMLVIATGTASTGVINIAASPFTRFQEIQALWLTVSGVKRVLNYIPPNIYASRYEDNVAGIPEYFTFMDLDLYLLPAPADTYTYTALYYQKAVPLDSSNTSNWILSGHAGLYLYGAMYHASLFEKDEQRAALYAGLFEKKIMEIQRRTNAARQGGSSRMISEVRAI
jgi:hypothetical protein